MQSPPRPSPPSIDPAACPLCGQLNRCAMEIARETGSAPEACWCTEIDFNADLLARVPTEAQRLACICETCARRALAA
jgi:hypothetical protein